MENENANQYLAYEKEFIFTLEGLPLLWDNTNRDYLNKYKRNDALEILLDILRKVKPGANVQDVRNKINSLRSNYRRDLKKVIASQRTGQDHIPKSWKYEYLHFLNRFVLRQDLDWKDEELATQNSIDDGVEDLLKLELEESKEVKEEMSSINKGLRPPASKIRKLRKVVVSKSNEFDRACALVSPKTNLIAYEWSETLNRLEPRQRMFAKKAINDILFEAELGNLDRNSVQINISAQPCSSHYSYFNLSSSTHSS